MSVRVTKSNDMRGVFLPQTRDFIALLAAFAVALAIGLTVISQREEARQFVIAQRT